VGVVRSTERSLPWPSDHAPEADPAELLARIRGEDGCMRLDDGRLLVMLPSTGPAQAVALGERLGALTLTEAIWGESAAALIVRA
jgi:GGDEF domain-containing protein